MRRHLSLWVIVALAALLFACSSSKDSGGNNPPAVGKGNLAVTVQGASVTGAAIAAPAQIDCRLKQDGTEVDSWSPDAFEDSSGNYTFTWSDLDEGSYTLEVDLGWNGSTEVSGSADVVITKDETASVTVNGTPVDVITIPLASSVVWQPPSDPSTPGSDYYTTPSGDGIYKPQWFRFGPIPANADPADVLRVSVSVPGTSTGDVSFFVPGGTPAYHQVAVGATWSSNVINPAEGYYWAMVFDAESGAQFQIRFIYPYVP